ncbi:N-acetylmuramoyl-L-alanine amidase [Nocardioides sp. dk4132]|uniref:N-acetylmuramoyl-L-alanine amidase n=1 Tax=unclassified Nocardioides TaxID=2615069 RepID=UPI00129765DD|nr:MULTISPECIES: N-acetylmuramoyl-L-alanine amidase [unclassified Nocardioides]MQW76645.1 N-acetylmuramoyl-L-alanine amidase [Nocardioides sp. dk4132]QGA06990.1 N-acetylmuramoyl-L-alanine amidase [Nocardioides sp. dk884]
MRHSGHSSGPAMRGRAWLVAVVALTGLLAPPGAAASPATERLALGAPDASGVRTAEVALGERLVVPVAGGARTRHLDTAAYSMVGVTWRGEVEPAVRVRSRSAGSWTGWRPLETLEDGPGEGGGGETSSARGTHPLWVDDSDGVQVEVAGASGTPRALTLVLIDPGSRAADAATTPSVPPARAAVPGLARAAKPSRAPRPALRTRSDWGANERWRDGRPSYNRQLKQVHIHHTVNANNYSRRDVPGLLRGMYRYHTKSLGWSDIGYNFLVDRFGRIWVGRAGGPANRVRGAHTLGFNHTSVGIAVIGNHETAHPTRRTMNALVALSAWKLDKAGSGATGRVWGRSEGSDRYPARARVRLPIIDGHRDTNDTACPGQLLYNRLGNLRGRAQNRIDRF